MGQILQKDSIGKLSVLTATQASLAPSVITIGGQQFSTNTLFINSGTVGASGLDAGSLSGSNLEIWYVHAVLASGVPAIVASLSKTAPIGFTNFKWTGWVLVNNGTGIFAISANSTDWPVMPYVLDVTVNSGTNPFLGGIVVNNYQATRMGRHLKINLSLQANANGSTTPGTGTYYQWNLPPGLLASTEVNAYTGYQNGDIRGIYGYSDSANDNYYGHIQVLSPGAQLIASVQGTNSGGGSIASGVVGPGLNQFSPSGNQSYTFEALIPIAGWDPHEL